MPTNVIYATNFSDAVTEDHLREIFSAYGDVVSVEFGVDEKWKERFAWVEMDKEKSASKARNTLNGYEIDGRRLAVIPSDIIVRDKLSSKQQEVYERIVAELGETEKKPLRQIYAIIMLCGTNFAEALLDEAKKVYEDEGIPTSDQERKRTLGGVYFYIGRPRVYPDMGRILFNRHGKFYTPKEDEAEEAPAQEG